MILVLFFLSRNNHYTFRTHHQYANTVTLIFKDSVVKVYNFNKSMQIKDYPQFKGLQHLAEIQEHFVTSTLKWLKTFNYPGLLKFLAFL